MDGWPDEVSFAAGVSATIASEAVTENTRKKQNGSYSPLSAGGGNDNPMPPTSFWLCDGMEMKRSGEASKSGDYSILAEGIKLGGIIKNVSVQESA
ncbi:hypothetical protein [Paenibacillus sp. MBLB4367]|uniref:hypothetical protein n=1 Tax=Paenibacillus sp. MBLB4367 TaxID=3384767 RepID=UPI00390833CC